MDDRTDFSYDDSQKMPAQAGADGSASPPVILIQYRERSIAARLLPPALILVAAVAITAYRRTTPVFPPTSLARIAPRQSLASTDAKSVESEKIVVRAANRAQLEEKVETKPPQATEVSQIKASAMVASRKREDHVVEKPAVVVAAGAPSVASSATSPFEFDASDGLRRLEAVTVNPAGTREIPATPETARTPSDSSMEAVASSDLSVTPKPVPGPSRDDILRDIEREARDKEGQRKENETLKAEAHSLLLAESLDKARSERATFHQELRKILKEMGKSAGTEIEKLCQKFGRDMRPEVQYAYNRFQRTTTGHVNRQTTVETLRGIGIPEPVVLDYVASKVHNTMNTRGGPRDENEVRVRAAQFLLSYPLPATRKPATANESSEVSAVAPKR